MIINLQLSPNQLDDLQGICSIGAKSLHAAIDALRTLKEMPIRPYELGKAIETKLNTNDAQLLSRQLVSLLVLKRDRDVSADEIIDSLTKALQASNWNESQLASWNEVSVPLRELLSLESVSVVAKALDLAYDYTNLLMKARILTDMRPVYDDARKDIKGMIISLTLRMHYISEDGGHSISVALDDGDLKLLNQECEKALRKSQEAKRLMIDKLGLKSYIVGEEKNDEK